MTALTLQTIKRRINQHKQAVQNGEKTWDEVTAEAMQMADEVSRYFCCEVMPTPEKKAEIIRMMSATGAHVNFCWVNAAGIASEVASGGIPADTYPVTAKGTVFGKEFGEENAEAWWLLYVRAGLAYLCAGPSAVDGGYRFDGVDLARPDYRVDLADGWYLTISVFDLPPDQPWKGPFATREAAERQALLLCGTDG
jgi:hypothetical protein